MATKYDRIANELRSKVQSGEWKPGDRLPAETTLRDQFKVSLPTLRSALGVLRAEGLIESVHGIGTFVRAPRQRVRRTNERHQWEKDRAVLPEAERKQTGATERDTGLTIEVLSFSAEHRVIEADDDLAAAFDVPPGTKLLQRVFETRANGEDFPLSRSHSYLVHDMIKGNPELLDASTEPWPGGTQHQLRTVGIEVDRIIETFHARPPTSEEAERLGIGDGVAVVVLRKVLVDTAERVVEVADVEMAGDRTELVYTTKLRRWSE